MTAAEPPLSPKPARPPSLSAAHWGLMAVTFLMWGGFFLIIPLVTVHFVGELGWAAGAVGAVLGARQLAQQGLTAFGGAWADRTGPKGLILWGCLLRAAGFAGMAFSATFPALLLAGLVAGLGGALFDAPKSAAITALTPPEDRSRVFTLNGVAGNLGMVIGPLVGAAMTRLGFEVAALLSASMYLLCWLILKVTLPNVQPGAAGSGGSGLDGLKAALHDRRFVNFTLVLIGYFLLSTQINVAVTLRAVELAGPGATGPLYGLTAGMAVLLQYPLLRLAERHLPTRTILMAAVTLVALGLGAMGLAQSFAGLLACVAVYSLGTMLVLPTQQTLVSRLAPPEMVGSYFGFSAISLGVGGAVGNLLGGSLVDFGRHTGQAALPWLILMGIGLLTVAGLSWALKDIPRATEAH